MKTETKNDKRVKKIEEKARKAWIKLYDAETEFIHQWDKLSPEEKDAMVYRGSGLNGYQVFRMLG